MKAEEAFDDIIMWLLDNRGDVSSSAFVLACERVLQLALREGYFSLPKVKDRYPTLELAKVKEGYPTLELAAVLLRTHIPTDAMYPSLPGYFTGD